MRSLSKFITDYFEIETDSFAFKHIYGASLKYLTKTISSRELHKRLKKVSGKSIHVYRLQLTNDGYYILNIKMWLIHAIANKRNPAFDSKKELKNMGIMKRDRELLEKFSSDSELRKQISAIVFQLGGRKNIPTISRLKSLLVSIIEMAEVKLKPLINNLIWTKLKFLIQCGSLDLESVRCEFKAKIVQTFYWQMPYQKENVYHWVMSMIKPLKNHAINLIHFHTTQKRGRMTEEDGVYVVNESPIDSIENEKLLGDNNVVTVNIESKIEAQQLIRKYAITQKRIKAFKLMSGVYDKGFTQWLRETRQISANSNLDNTDLQEQISNITFLKLVSKYVKLKWKYFRRVILSIRNTLELEGYCYGNSAVSATTA